MKIPLAALTLTLAGRSPTPATAPTPAPGGAPQEVRRVLMMEPLEFSPSVVSERPVPMSALREKISGSAGVRLARLDGRVSNLRARADQSTARLTLENDFAMLKNLRGHVAAAMTNLKNPELGCDSAQKALDDALDQLDLAISAVVRN